MLDKVTKQMQDKIPHSITEIKQDNTRIKVLPQNKSKTMKRLDETSSS